MFIEYRPICRRKRRLVSNRRRREEGASPPRVEDKRQGIDRDSEAI
jgi:hypothetical protein